ncbi:MAG: antibiotic biosynthesis monooxygenase [Acidobacteria bacterium]|nr:MAG: antibiotic biosynthesis monooxygenase [Acidobacteriota bacterium]
MLAITVRFHIRSGHGDAFFERVRQQAKDSLDREAACRQFDVCRNPQNPLEVFLYEIYDDEAAFAAHLTMPHFLAFDADVKGWVEGKIVEKWNRA